MDRRARSGRRARHLVIACAIAASAALSATAQADPLDALVANDLQYAAAQLQAAASADARRPLSVQDAVALGRMADVGCGLVDERLLPRGASG